MRTLASMVVFVLLAGCSGGGGGGGSDEVDEDAPVTLDAPTWHLGDWWNFTTPGGESTFVITSEEGTDWFMETDNSGTAFYNARNDISTLGKVSKAELAGSQGSQRVDYFQWPLTDGATWEMMLDGQDLDVVAHATDDGMWHFEGSNSTGLYVSYMYDPEVEWFSVLTFYGSDGSEQYTSEINDWGHNYTGLVDRWTLEVIYSDAGALTGGDSSTGNFDVPLTATDVWVAMHVVCPEGSALIGVAPFPVLHATFGIDDRGAGTEPPCPLEEHDERSIGAPREPPGGGAEETWTYGVAVAPGTTGTFSFEILVRTLESVAPFTT